MKVRTLLGLCSAALFAGGSSSADTKLECVHAAESGQDLRDAHKLVEALAQFRVCAAENCPSGVRSDCASWSVETEKALPSVVVSAKSGAGTDLLDVEVTVDGALLVSKLDGDSLPINPGVHAFHFRSAGGATLDRQVLVREGDKSQPVSVVLAESPVIAAPAPSAASAPLDSHPPAGSGPWRPLGWAAVGGGAVGLGVAGAFGLIALVEEGAHCTNHQCDPGTSSEVKRDALIADVGLMAGGVLVAAGVTLLLVGPHGSTASIHAAPVVATNGAGATLEGRW